ncbi:hypothetical protein [uncultured Maricaulis sp.]|uniref:hypothetical protein n=1 Tax=uncultured Maricaulis sp. TaxID=174710 RepID=UPI0030D890CC|tara:strand:+ start:18620 stop:19123 length:504 start_codon:yes stop_codon:yes gene_type:complete
MTLTAKIAAAALLASIGMAGFAGVASAGTWHANAAACPDLREDRIDARYTSGRADRREDFRDQQVINCPAHAWSYYPDRYERTDMRRMTSPGTVYLDRSGRYYAVDRRGASYNINVIIDYPRQTPVLGVRLGARAGVHDDRYRDSRRDYRSNSRDRRDVRHNRRGHH